LFAPAYGWKYNNNWESVLPLFAQLDNFAGNLVGTKSTKHIQLQSSLANNICGLYHQTIFQKLQDLVFALIASEGSGHTNYFVFVEQKDG
jgi:hypothetical protein